MVMIIHPISRYVQGIKWLETLEKNEKTAARQYRPAAVRLAVGIPKQTGTEVISASSSPFLSKQLNIMSEAAIRQINDRIQLQFRAKYVGISLKPLVMARGNKIVAKIEESPMNNSLLPGKSLLALG
jgi:hypothetical protein